MKNFLFVLVLGLCGLFGFVVPAVAVVSLDLPPGVRFINGTGQLPIINSTFKAPGFTSQGYIEICENAGPNIYFIGLNASAVPLTIRNSFRTSFDMTSPPVRITYAERNKKLGLKNGADETVVEPMQFYVSDPVPIKVKAGDLITLRTFVPLSADTPIGCGIISGSEGNATHWYYGNTVGGTDRTLDPTLEASFTPTSDLLYVPFLVMGDHVRKDSHFVVAFGDSLTFQLAKDKGGTWFQDTFSDTPHANLAIGGDALGNVIAPTGELKSPMQEARFAIAHYATEILNFYGHNDLGNSCPLDTMLQLDKAFCARPEIAGIPKWRCILTPFVHYKPGVKVENLTDADQTPDKTAPTILKFDDIMRAQFKDYGYTGIIDIGSVLAENPESLFWKPGMAGDGTHFGRNANPLIAPLARRILSADK